MKAEAAAKNKAAGGEEIKLPESSLTCPEGSYHGDGQSCIP